MVKLRIKELCKERGLTQKELAKILGYTEVSITNISKGQTNVSTLENIANALGVSVGTLFEAENTAVCPHCGKPIKVTLNK